MTFHNANEFFTFPVSRAPLSRITVHEDSKTLLTFFFVKHNIWVTSTDMPCNRSRVGAAQERLKSVSPLKGTNLNLPFSSRSFQETYSTYFPNELCYVAVKEASLNGVLFIRHFMT